ncbi:hypothetical protein M8U48_22320, partial [Enterobacter hormaechei]|nr:hypothetical protein [Enterobacter hormaechei]
NNIIPPLCFIFQSWGGLFVSTWGIIALIEKRKPAKKRVWLGRHYFLFHSSLKKFSFNLYIS